MSRQVRSVVRLRPPRRGPDADDVAGAAAAVRWSEEDGTVTVQSDSAGGSAAELNFDAVVGPSSACGTSQAAFYDVFVQPALGDALVNGTNATVLAYGQTGSGKTHTMASGSFNPSSIPNQYPSAAEATEAATDASLSSSANNSPQLGDEAQQDPAAVVVSEVDGVVPRALADVFATARTRGAERVTVRVSYYELYNETFRDLLWAAGSSSSSSSKGTTGASAAPKLRMRLRRGADGEPEFFVENLLSLSCASLEEALNWYRLGSIRRAVRGHAMNARSSRSHTIFAITVSWCDDADVDKEATVTLVDLAGSEKISSVAPGGRVAAPGGGRPRSSGRGGAGGYEALLGETARINSSLLALGKVIDALAKASSGAKAGSGAGTWAVPPHIPYRESKLTSVLRSAISHRSVTVVIACADPSYPDETLRTLNFASRARKITAQATLRPGMYGGDAKTRLIADLRLRIAELEGKLAAMAAELEEARNETSPAITDSRPPSSAAAVVVATATAHQPLADQSPARRAEDAATSMAEVEAAVRAAKAEADTVIRPLSTKLVASCERLQAVVAANTGLRAALDGAMLRCREQEGERLVLEEENAGLRDRIQMLEDALLAPTATERWLSGQQGHPDDRKAPPRSAPSTLRPRPPTLPASVAATTGSSPSASAAQGLAATYGGGRHGSLQQTSRPRRQPAKARTPKPDSEPGTPKQHGGHKRGTPRSARHRPSTDDPLSTGPAAERAQPTASTPRQPHPKPSPASQPNTPRRSKPAPPSLSSGATLASLLGGGTVPM